MRELIHVEDHRGQLMCDNPDCFHELAEGDVEWGEHLIGYPCPMCNENMLTRRDYEASERFNRWIAWVNRWFGWMGKEYSAADKDWSGVGIRHHNGKLIYRQEDER